MDYEIQDVPERTYAVIKRTVAFAQIPNVMPELMGKVQSWADTVPHGLYMCISSMTPGGQLNIAPGVEVATDSSEPPEGFDLVTRPAQRSAVYLYVGPYEGLPAVYQDFHAQLFHHAQGQTPGFLAFAEELRAAGHVVHVPDLYDGRTFTDLDAGVGYAKEVGFETIGERGRLAVAGLSNQLVYAGFSLGVMSAQELAQTRPGAKGALLFSAAFPASEFGGSWPRGVPLQIHMMEDDEWAMEDLPAARELVEMVEGAELFLYPGDRHLFADSSLADYDEAAANLLKQRVLSFLGNVE